MRTLLLLIALVIAFPAEAQIQASGRANETIGVLEDGDVLFGRIGLSSPYLEDQGSRSYYALYTHDAVAGERVMLSAQSLEFAPALLAAGGPGLDPDRPSIEISADGQTARMDFYAPETGTYAFAVVATGIAAPSSQGNLFQVSLDATPPLDYATVYRGGGDRSERYALLVGVNDYPAVDSDLSGTVNDVMKLRSVLVDRYGFLPANVVVLTDADATREHVIEAFRRHLGQAGPTGSALFYYSGHGTQIPDSYLGMIAGDEADGNDEALVLWGRGGNFGYLIDEEVGALADNLTAGHRLVVLDNCHSGTGTRDGADEASLVNVRFLDFEGDGLSARSDLPNALVREVSTDASPARHVLLAAARSDQYSIETSGLTGESGGIFTYYLTNALKKADPDMALADLMEGIRAKVVETTEALQFEGQLEGQEPQTEGTMANEPIRAFLMR